MHIVIMTSPPEPPAGTSPSTRTPAVRPNAVVGVLALAGIVAAVMQTLVVPLIGELPHLLDTSASNATWVVTSTLLAAAVATPISGRLGDLYGKRRIMLACSTLLVAGSLVCALATSVVPMIAGRALQGAAMGLIPLGISAMRDLLPAERLGTSIALMSASMGIGGALGLPVAAAVAEYANWRMLFWGATALAVMIAVLIHRFIPATPVTARGRFDPIGAVGLGLALVGLLLGVSKGTDWGWTSGTTLTLLVGAVVVLLAWGWFELRTADPLVDLRVTARPVVLLTNLASIVIGFAMYAQSLIVPQLLQLPTATGYGLGQDMLQMGLWMAPSGLMMMVVSPSGARLSRARGPKTTLALGAAIVSLGYLSAIVLMGSTWGLLVAVCISTAGVGLAYGAMPALIMGSVPVSETGSANSVNTLMRSIGTSVSAAVVGVVLANMSMDLGGIPLPSEAGFRVGLGIGAGVAALASVIALCIPTRAARAAEDRIEHPAELRRDLRRHLRRRGARRHARLSGRAGARGTAYAPWPRPPVTVRHSPEHQRQRRPDDEHRLDAVDDDPQPRAAVATGRQGQRHRVQQRRRDRPRQVQVVDREQDPVGQPVGPPEDATHPGQEQAAEQQLLAEHRVEEGHDDDHGEPPPVAGQELVTRGRPEELPQVAARRGGHVGKHLLEPDDEHSGHQHPPHTPTDPTRTRAARPPQPQRVRDRAPPEGARLAPDQHEHESALPDEADGEAGHQGLRPRGRSVQPVGQRRGHQPGQCRHRQGCCCPDREDLTQAVLRRRRCGFGRTVRRHGRCVGE